MLRLQFIISGSEKLHFTVYKVLNLDILDIKCIDSLQEAFTNPRSHLEHFFFMMYGCSLLDFYWTIGYHLFTAIIMLGRARILF